jgi:hypothetical protein
MSLVMPNEVAHVLKQTMSEISSIKRKKMQPNLMSDVILSDLQHLKRHFGGRSFEGEVTTRRPKCVALTSTTEKLSIEEPTAKKRRKERK